MYHRRVSFPSQALDLRLYPSGPTAVDSSDGAQTTTLGGARRRRGPMVSIMRWAEEQAGEPLGERDTPGAGDLV